MEPSKEMGQTPKRRIPRPDNPLHKLPQEVTQLPPEATQLPPGAGPWDVVEETPTNVVKEERDRAEESTADEVLGPREDPADRARAQALEQMLEPAEEALRISQQQLAARVTENERPLIARKPRKRTSPKKP